MTLFPIPKVPKRGNDRMMHLDHFVLNVLVQYQAYPSIGVKSAKIFTLIYWKIP